MLCRYLGQLLGATDEADELLCKGIDILKQDVEAVVCTQHLVFNTEHLRSLDYVPPAPVTAQLKRKNMYRFLKTNQGHQQRLRNLRALCPQHCAAWQSCV